MFLNISELFISVLTLSLGGISQNLGINYFGANSIASQNIRINYFGANLTQGVYYSRVAVTNTSTCAGTFTTTSTATTTRRRHSSTTTIALLCFACWW